MGKEIRKELQIVSIMESIWGLNGPFLDLEKGSFGISPRTQLTGSRTRGSRERESWIEGLEGLVGGYDSYAIDQVRLLELSHKNFFYKFASFDMNNLSLPNQKKLIEMLVS